MTTPKNNTLIDGCFFLIAALLLWLYSQHIRHHRWVVLKQSIRFEEGFSLAESFTVDVPTDYWLEVECRKTVPFKTLDSILTTELAVSYSVSAGERHIVDGESTSNLGAGHSQDDMSRHIGTFRAVPGKTYRLDMRVTRSLPQLASTRPVAKVSVDPLICKGALVKASLLSFLAIGIAIVTLVCITPALWSYIFPRHDDNNRNA